MANFILRNVDDDLWEQFKTRATAEGRAMRWLVVELITYYVQHGLPKKR